MWWESFFLQKTNPLVLENYVLYLNSESFLISELKGEKNMAKFVCKVCGYVYEGDAAPAECPVCHVGADLVRRSKR